MNEDGWNEQWSLWMASEARRAERGSQRVMQATKQVTEVAELDPAWVKRLLFVQHRRPDAVATR